MSVLAHPPSRSLPVRVAGWVEPRAHRLLGGWLAVVALVGSAYAVHVGSTLRYSEEQQYLTLADNIRKHAIYSLDGRGPTAYRPPLWPLVLAVGRLLGAGVVELRILDVGLLVVAVALAYGVGAALAGPLGGLLAAVLTGAYPLLVYTATTLYPQTLALLLLTLVLWLLRPGTTASWRRLILAGVVVGLLVLTVSTFAYLVPLVALVHRGGWRQWATRTAVVLLGFAVVVGAWTVRNERAEHHLFFVASNSGFNLLLGNSEHAGADTGVDANITRYTDHGGTIGDEVVRDNYYRDQALHWIGTHPASAAWLYARKTLNFFNSANRLSTTGKTSLAQGVVLTGYYVGLLALLAWRWWRRHCVPFDRFEVVVLVLYGLGALLSAVFFTRTRFRAPFDVLVVVAVARLARTAPPIPTVDNME